MQGNVTTTEELLQNNDKTQSFLLQREKEIDKRTGTCQLK